MHEEPEGDALRVELDDGRAIWLDDGEQPPFADMPAGEVVETVPESGAPMVIVDHRDAIEAELAAWNGEHDAGCSCRIARLRLDGLLLVGLCALGLRIRRRR